MSKPAVSFQGIKDAAVRNALQALVTFVRTGDGQTGDPKEAYLKRGDLTDARILQMISTGITGPGGPGTGGGGGTGVTPDLTPPDPPTGFEVMGGYDSIYMTWNATNDQRVGFAEVFRHTSDSRANAVKIGVAQGTIYRDADVVRGQTYYYWVRYVSKWSTIENWIVSGFNAIEGTAGASGLDVEALLEALEDQLTESQLYQDLIDRINLIDAPGTGLVEALAQEILDRAAAITEEASDRAAAILAEITARIAADDALQVDVDAITTTLTHGTTGLAAAHSRVDGVLVDIDEVTGDMEALALEMDTTTATANSASSAASAAVTTANSAQSRLNNVNGAGMSVESLAAAVESLTASSGEDGTLAAAAYSEAAAVKTRINNVDGGGKTIETLASESSTLAAAVNHGTTGLSATRTTANSAVARLNNTGAGQTIEALTTQVSTINATITHGTTGLSAAHSRIATAENRLNNTGTGGLSLESIASNSEATRAAVNHGTTGLAATKTVADNAIARLNNTGGGVSVEALNSSMTGLAATVNHAGTGLAAAHTRSQNLETRASNVGGTGRTLEVLGTDFSSLRSQVLDPATGLSALATLVTSHTTSITSQGNSITSLTTAVTQLSSTVGNNTAAISQEATTRANQIGQLNAKVTLKLDVNGYVTGWTANNDGQQGEMIIVADRFTIAPVPTNPAANDGSPFFYLTVPTVVNGATLPAGLYLKRAHIGAATITSAQIESLVVEKLTGNLAQFIQGNFNILQSSNFSDVARRGWQLNVNGNHKIYGTGASEVVANTMQSSNYQTGVSGFFLSHNGFFEAQNAYIRGDVEATSLKVDAANIVKTLHLAGNSVFVGEFAVGTITGVQLPSNTQNSQNFGTIISKTFSFDGTAGQPLMIEVMSYVYWESMGDDPEQRKLSFRVLLNGAAVGVAEVNFVTGRYNDGSSSVVRYQQNSFIKALIAPGPGTHTVTFQARRPPFSSAGNTTSVMSIIGGKR